MYLPKDFELTDASAIADLIKQAPLSVLTCHTDEGLRADHIPLMLGKDRLIGHIARANSLHEIIADGHPVLAVFRADDSYISANWYPSKADTHEVVPTWNYEVVHVHGTIHFHHDEQTKRQAVGQLTKMMEHRTNGAKAWRMADAPADFMIEKLKEIVAFDIRIDRITGKQKLSQNKSASDRLGAADGVASLGKSAMSKKMRG